MVNELCETKRFKELPGVVPQAVYNILINDFVGEWETICLRWFVGVHQYAEDFATKICRRHFGEYEQSGLDRQAK